MLYELLPGRRLGWEIEQLADELSDVLGRPVDVHVLGEASAQFSEELKARYPDVPWQQPSRLRNRIVEGCWSIDLQILYTTAQDQLPGFAEQVRQVLAAVVGEDSSSEA